MSKEMAMIHLSGMGDEDIKLVPVFVCKWVDRSYVEDHEELPEEVYEYFKESAKASKCYDEDTVERTIHVTIGSPDNDRALQTIVPDETTFFDMQDALEYIRENDIKIVETYNGVIY